MAETKQWVKIVNEPGVNLLLGGGLCFTPAIPLGVFLVIRAWYIWSTRSQKKKLIRLTEKFGEDAAKRIIEKKIWQGMSYDMLVESWGKPGKIEETVKKDSTNYKLYYQSYQNSKNQTSYKKRVDVENDEVVGWRDL